MNFTSVFHMLRGPELNAASRYGPTSVLSREADCLPCCSSSAPLNTAEDALGLRCHQETPLPHMLLDPSPVLQVLLNSTGSHSVPTSSSARVFPSQLEDFPYVLTEFYEVSVSLFLQPAELSVSGSPALKCVDWFLPGWCYLQA